jgi:hypothetical protein
MEDVSVMNIALHRSVAVTAGGVWAALVSRYWWRTEARRELSRGLGELRAPKPFVREQTTDLIGRFCLNMGWLYTRLVAYNSFVYEDENGYHATPTESTALLKSLNNDDIHEFMSM